jgi:hypothetical protein
MFAVALILIFAVLPVFAQEKGWEKEWNEVLAGAKREGTVRIAGSPDPVIRNVIFQNFSALFGVPV